MNDIQIDNKQRITIRLDSEIIDFFKSNHENYQTAINETLLKHINRITLTSLAQRFYSELKLLKDRKFIRFMHLVGCVKIDELSISFERTGVLWGLVKTIFPDMYLDIEDLNNDFFKCQEFTKFLLATYMVNQLGFVVAEDVGNESVYDNVGAFAIGLGFLDITLDEFENHFKDDLVWTVLTTEEELLEEFQDWDDLTESNQYILAMGSINQTSEKVNDELLEYKVKINSLQKLYQYYSQGNNKIKKKINVNQIYEDFLTVLYTRIAYQTQNYGGGDIWEIPHFIIFKLMISDLVKLYQAEKTRNPDVDTDLPIYYFKENGFIWDLSAFIIPTKVKPVLGFNGSMFFNTDDGEEMNYLEVYKPHLKELLSITKDEEEKDSIKILLGEDDDK